MYTVGINYLEIKLISTKFRRNKECGVRVQFPLVLIIFLTEKTNSDENSIGNKMVQLSRKLIRGNPISD